MAVRRVAAVLAADVVGYTRRMAEDELTTLRQLGELRQSVLYPAIARAEGRVFKEMGDGLLAEFASVVSAVECGHAIQSQVPAAARDSQGEPLQLRIGIHFGEVVAEGDDLFGETVNMAARIEAAAGPGEVWLSEQARQMVGNRTALAITSQGAHNLKGFADPAELFAVRAGDTAPPGASRPQRRSRANPRNLALAGVVLAAAIGGVVVRFALAPDHTSVDTAASLPSGLRHGEVFRDCDECPQMVAVAGGELLMGAPEEGIASGLFPPEQGPQRLVDIAPFAVAQREVTRAEFSTFLDASDHQRPTGCRTWEDGTSAIREDRSFDDPGFPQEEDHPAVCISWHDARAFADWLARKTGEPYRLLTEAEWEFVARAGADTRFSFGADPDEVCAFDNVADATARSRWDGWETALCSDGRVFTGPVGSYDANPFGVFDIYGNVREWVQDCWHQTFAGAPVTGEAWTTPGCDLRVVRGGSWDSKPSIISSSHRGRLPADHRDFLYGFRVARDLNAD